MNTSTLDNIEDVPPGMDIYEAQVSFITPVPMVSLASIPQGGGSRLDADTVDGLQAVTAAKAGPNRLVATGSDGLLPASIVPAGTPGAPGPAGPTGATGTFIIYNRSATQAYTLLVEDDGALSYEPVGNSGGIVLNRAGNLRFRLYVEDDGALSYDPA